MADLLELIPVRQGSQYTRQHVIEAATHYVATGSTTLAAAAAGVPESTFRDWRNYPWWDAVTVEIRRAKQDELDGALTGLIHKAVSAASERLESGDSRLVKRRGEDGQDRVELVRVPVSAKDAAIVAAIAADKRQIVRGQATEIVEHSSDKLRLMQEHLRALSGRTIEGQRVETIEQSEAPKP